MESLFHGRTLKLIYILLVLNRKTVKLLANGGDMIELCQELRLPFVNWVVANQVLHMEFYLLIQIDQDVIFLFYFLTYI